jgi:hypothetical protein
MLAMASILSTDLGTAIESVAPLVSKHRPDLLVSSRLLLRALSSLCFFHAANLTPENHLVLRPLKPASSCLFINTL